VPDTDAQFALRDVVIALPTLAGPWSPSRVAGRIHPISLLATGLRPGPLTHLTHLRILTYTVIRLWGRSQN